MTIRCQYAHESRGISSTFICSNKTSESHHCINSQPWTFNVKNAYVTIKIIHETSVNTVFVNNVDNGQIKLCEVHYYCEMISMANSWRSLVTWVQKLFAYVTIEIIECDLRQALPLPKISITVIRVNYTTIAAWQLLDEILLHKCVEIITISVTFWVGLIAFSLPVLSPPNVSPMH